MSEPVPLPGPTSAQMISYREFTSLGMALAVLPELLEQRLRQFPSARVGVCLYPMDGEGGVEVEIRSEVPL